MFALLFFQPDATQQDYVAPAIKVFIETTTGILSSGDALFQQIVKMQVDSVLADLAHDTTKLHGEKHDLRDSIAAGTITDDQLREKVSEITGTLWDLQKEMGRFSSEIAKVSGYNSKDFQNAVSDLDRTKRNELHEVQRQWEMHNIQASLTLLDHALGDTERLQSASECLSRSVSAKKVVCDASTFKTLP
jgi:hypothetical protein